MNIKQISTDACNTHYDVDGHKLHLWIISGGTPCLAFEDYSFDQRYPITDQRWAENFWSKDDFRVGHRFLWNGHYSHQDPQNLQGPTLDVLPNGEVSALEFLDKYLPLKAIREARFAQIMALSLPWEPMSSFWGLAGHKELRSKKIRDKENHTLVEFVLHLYTHSIGPVIAESKVYSGRCEGEIQRWAPVWFKKAANFFNPLVDHKPHKYEELTAEQFQEVLSILREYA